MMQSIACATRNILRVGFLRNYSSIYGREFEIDSKDCVLLSVPSLFNHAETYVLKAQYHSLSNSRRYFGEDSDNDILLLVPRYDDSSRENIRLRPESRNYGNQVVDTETTEDLGRRLSRRQPEPVDGAPTHSPTTDSESHLTPDDDSFNNSIPKEFRSADSGHKRNYFSSPKWLLSWK